MRGSSFLIYELFLADPFLEMITVATHSARGLKKGRRKFKNHFFGLHCLRKIELLSKVKFTKD